MIELPAAAKRVEAAAQALGLQIEVCTMPASTRTAAEAAAAVQASVGQIVKSLVFKGKTTGKPHLILVSGTNRVDEPAMAAVLGEAITRPDAEFVRAATGFAIGGVPPFGHAVALATFMDEDLLQYETIWRRRGRHTRSSRSRPTDSGKRFRRRSLRSRNRPLECGFDGRAARHRCDGAVALGR